MDKLEAVEENDISIEMPKKKKVLTEKQVESLKKGRESRLEKKLLKDELSSLKPRPKTTVVEVKAPVIEIPEKKKKGKKQVIIIQEESSDDDEPIIIKNPKQKQPITVSEPIPIPIPEPIQEPTPVYRMRRL